MSTPTSGNDHTPDQSKRCTKQAGAMNCQECVDFLLDYADGVLPDAQRTVFDAHLSLCPNCVTYVDNYKLAASLTAGLSRPQRAGIPDAIPEGLIEAILKARKQQS